MDVAKQAVEALGKHLNQFDGKFKTLEEFTLEENDNIRKELDGRKAVGYEVKEAITSLECRLMDALSKMEAISARMKTLKGGTVEGRYVVSIGDREARIKSPKPPVFNGSRDAQKVENFLWHLENYFKWN